MKFEIFTKTFIPDPPMIGMYTPNGKIDGISGYNARKFFRIGERSIEPNNIVALEFWIKDSEGEHRLLGCIEDIAYERGVGGFISSDEIEFTSNNKVKIAIAKINKDNRKKKQTPLF
jgi:hypothetical protein